MQLAALAFLAALVVPVLLLLGWAFVDNKVKTGFWRVGRHDGPVRPPLPFAHLTDADRDAWMGGNGGAP